MAAGVTGGRGEEGRIQTDICFGVYISTKRLGQRRQIIVFQGSLFTKQETRYIVLKKMNGSGGGGLKRIKRVRNNTETGGQLGNEVGK